MNNLAGNFEFEEDKDNVSPLLLVTRKTLVQAADRFMANAVGVYSQKDVFDAVRLVVGSANKKLLEDEIAWAIALDRIKTRSKPRLKNNDDWIGYGEMAITLPESKIVNVFYASTSALDHRKQNVIENKEKIIRAADLEIGRITELQGMMAKIMVDTAGPAIKIFSAIAEKRKKL